MKLKHLCDPQMLEQFLCGALPAPQAQELSDHLNVCESCGEALEAQAAEPSEWSEASVLLGDHKIGDQDAGLSGKDSRNAPIQHVLSQLAPTEDPHSMGRIGGYEVTGVIGSGGMGVVLKAYDRSLDRVVAVKVMALHLAASGSARQRFAREAKAAAAVLHPNVIAIHGVSNQHALPYLVMPYVRGESLQKRIDVEGPLPLIDILRIGTQVAAGLAAAHEQGLVHRDIKPGNILMEQGVERVTITDFGLARAVDDASMTRSGVIAGTPQYMSPEQARGEPIDARSDLFSLGSLLYAMCTGHSPFRAETSFGVIHRITHDEPRSINEINPDIPIWLECVVIHLLSKSTSERFQSAAEVAELLACCLSHAQCPASTPLPEAVLELSARTTKPPRWLRFLSTACLLPMLILAGVFIVLEWNKGTLRIESEADDVPIRVLQGDLVVENLIVSKSGKTVRIAAGVYEVEIGGQMDGVIIEDGKVTLQRGEEDLVRVVGAGKKVNVAESREERLKYPDGKSFGITLSTRVYDVSEFVDFDLSISLEMQCSILIGLLQQTTEHADPVDYWTASHNIVVRGTDSTHDEIVNTLKQLRFCKQQVRRMMSLNAEIERLQEDLSDIPDAERTSQRSKILQQKIDVAMVTRSEQIRGFQFTLAKLRAEQAKIEPADGQNIRQVVSPDHELTSGKLSQIMRALHRYHDLHKQLPMAAIPGKDGSGGPAHSWRVELLPLLGHQKLYDQYHFGEPWDSPHNRTLLSAMPDVYRSPLDSPDSVHASFFAVTSSPEPIERTQPSTDLDKEAKFLDGGESSYSSSASGGFSEADDKSTESLRALRPPRTTLFWTFDNTRFHSVTDGTSHTIALVEAKREIPWTQPSDIEYSNDQPLPAMGGWFESGWHAAFVDGHVRFFSNSQDKQALRNLLTIDDGQSVK